MYKPKPIKESTTVNIHCKASEAKIITGGDK